MSCGNGVRETFERLSADYDARFPSIIPRYVEFHQVIVQRVAEQLAGGGDRQECGAAQPRDPRSTREAGSEEAAGGAGNVVDLGCGTGELSRCLLETLPSILVHCVDLAPAMIERAREKLSPWADRVTFEVGDFLSVSLPMGSSAVVSALAIHHLEGRDKRALFRKIFECLRRRGIFVMGDAVDGDSPAYSDYYTRRWVEHMRDSGMDEAQITGVLDDHARNDRFSTLEEHLTWMREAGFERVECLWKYFLLVVLSGEKV
jgi:tRNA (cmo5U34)-methyltransferase